MMRALSAGSLPARSSNAIFLNPCSSGWTIQPEEHGFKKIALEDLAGSEPANNARIIVTILDGKGPAGARAATLLNAAAAIYVSGRVRTYADGIAAAKKSIDSGQAKSVLDRLRRASPKAVKTAT